MRVTVALGRGPLPPGAAPRGGPLIDTFCRVHTDLRLSVTDRCNKLPGHGVNDPGFVQPARPMSRIGG